MAGFKKAGTGWKRWIWRPRVQCDIKTMAQQIGAVSGKQNHVRFMKFQRTYRKNTSPTARTSLSKGAIGTAFIKVVVLSLSSVEGRGILALREAPSSFLENRSLKPRVRRCS